MLFGNMLAYYMWLRGPSEAKIQAADPSGIGHFGKDVLGQELGIAASQNVGLNRKFCKNFVYRAQ
jgi:hypothetical protein